MREKKKKTGIIFFFVNCFVTNKFFIFLFWNFKRFLCPGLIKLTIRYWSYSLLKAKKLLIIAYIHLSLDSFFIHVIGNHITSSYFHKGFGKYKDKEDVQKVKNDIPPPQAFLRSLVRIYRLVNNWENKKYWKKVDKKMNIDNNSKVLKYSDLKNKESAPKI